MVLVLIMFFVNDRRQYVSVVACLCVLAFLLCVCFVCVFAIVLEFVFVFCSRVIGFVVVDIVPWWACCFATSVLRMGVHGLGC